jgi:hypothetical protein
MKTASHLLMCQNLKNQRFLLIIFVQINFSLEISD